MRAHKLLSSQQQRTLLRLKPQRSENRRRSRASNERCYASSNKKKLKVVVFSTSDYEREILEKQLNSHFHVTFLKPRLTIETVDLAHGYDAMCCFVNDDLSADVIERLSEKCGVKMIALRCAGFDKVDVESCKKFGVLVYRVPMYDPLSIAEHAMALILALNRKLMISHSRVKSGNFT
jgi:D-lactate dehydrogenase